MRLKMIRKLRPTWFGVLALVLALLGPGSLVGCTSSAAGSADSTSSGAANSGAGSAGSSTVYPAPDSITSSTVNTTGTNSAFPDLASGTVSSRKVVFTYNYSLESTEMSATIAALQTAVNQSGGYVESSNYSGRQNSEEYSYVNLTCRIPVDAVPAFQQAIEAAGHVVQKSEAGQDITDQYFDTEGRLTVLTAERDRLLAMMNTTGSMSDMLQLEQQLTQVLTEIESLTGTLQKYDTLVDLATFTITINQVQELTPISDDSFSAQVAQAWSDSVAISVNVLKGLLFALIFLAPYLVTIVVILLVVLLLVRHHRRKHPKMPPRRPPLPSELLNYPPPIVAQSAATNPGPTSPLAPKESDPD
ncbi:MAG: DUF4349 domain-containing protein [Actinomycetia bacterium]|nr:DUF4349 domain-containing protein [Actinomycetes bacterium]